MNKRNSHYILLVACVCVCLYKKQSLKCEWNNIFITDLTCKFVEVSSEIPRTFLGPGTLQVMCLDGSVKYSRACGTFSTQEELVQEEVKSTPLEEIPVPIEKILEEPRGSERWKVLF